MFDEPARWCERKRRARKPRFTKPGSIAAPSRDAPILCAFARSGCPSMKEVNDEKPD